MKRKILTSIIFILGLFILTGCENKTKDDPNSNKTDNGFTVLYSSTNVLPGTEFKKAFIKEEASYSEIPSCAFEGTDKVYTYSNAEITTSEVDGKEIVYSVYFLNENISTYEDVKITDSKAVMLEKYGDDYENFGQKYSYTKGGVELAFVVEEDIITSIEYTLVIE